MCIIRLCLYATLVLPKSSDSLPDCNTSSEGWDMGWDLTAQRVSVRRSRLSSCAAINPSCSWLRCICVGCLSKVIALEGASVCVTESCIVKHSKFFLPVSQQLCIIRCKPWPSSSGCCVIAVRSFPTPIKLSVKPVCLIKWCFEPRYVCR